MIIESLAFTIARWALLAVALWWVAGFVLWTVALSDRQAGTTPRVSRLADRFALPGCRRLAMGIAACALVTLPACSPAESQPSLVYLGEADSTTATTARPATTMTTPPTTRAPATQPPTTQSPTTQSPTTQSPTTLPLTAEPPATTPPSTETQTPPDPTAPEPVEPTTPLATSHQVVAGDHLWGIAAQHLSLLSPDSSPSNAAIARYWRQVITANAATLRSGDPNLIHPGEWVSLPPVG